MAEIDTQTATELTNALNNLARRISGSGEQSIAGNKKEFREFNKSLKDLTTSTNQARSADLQTAAAMKSYTSSWRGIMTSQQKFLQKFQTDLKSHTKVSGEIFNKAVENFDEKQLGQTADVFKANAENITGFSNAVIHNIKSLSDVLAIQEQNAQKAKNIGAFEKYQEKLRDIQMQLDNRIISEEEYQQRISAAKDELMRFGFTAEDTNLNLGQMQQQIVDVNTAFERTSHSLSGGNVAEFSSNLRSAAGRVAAFGAATLGAARYLSSLAETSLKTGTSLDLFDSALMGMSPDELSSLQAEYRQTMRAADMQVGDFNEAISEGVRDMYRYTGSLRDAARVNAMSLRASQLFGDTTGQIAANQEESFKRLNRTFSTTADQFIDLNEQLMDSNAVHSQMFKMDQMRRLQQMNELTMLREKLRLEGLNQQQTQQLIETMEQMGGQKAATRIEQAARLQATLGAVGMGAQGQQAATLLRRGFREEGDRERFAEIMRQANIRVGEGMQNLAGELQLETMIGATGLESYLGPQSEFARLNTQQNLATDRLVSENDEQTSLLTDMLGATQGLPNQLAALLGGPLGQIGGAATLLTGTLGTLSNVLTTVAAAKFIGGGVGAAGGAAGGIAGAVGGTLARAAGMGARLALGATGIGAIGLAGYGAYRGIQALRNRGQEQSPARGNVDEAVNNMTRDTQENLLTSQQQLQEELKNLQSLFRELTTEQIGKLNNIVINTGGTQTAITEQTDSERNMKVEEQRQRERLAREASARKPTSSAADF